jgi:hypothetical protein
VCCSLVALLNALTGFGGVYDIRILYAYRLELNRAGVFHGRCLLFADSAASQILDTKASHWLAAVCLLFTVCYSDRSRESMQLEVRHGQF